LARITKPLTNTQIEQAKPKTKVYTLSDGSGLQLRVKPNGSKLWLFDYVRQYTKKRTSLSFGAYPALSLANARIKREATRELLSDNIDPKEERDEKARLNGEAHTNTLKYVAAQWL